MTPRTYWAVLRYGSAPITEPLRRDAIRRATNAWCATWRQLRKRAFTVRKVTIQEETK